jgi:hypothetical protein
MHICLYIYTIHPWIRILKVLTFAKAYYARLLALEFHCQGGSWVTMVKQCSMLDVRPHNLTSIYFAIAVERFIEEVALRKREE